MTPAEYLALPEFEWGGKTWTAVGPPVTPDRLRDEYLVPLIGLTEARLVAEGGTFTIADATATTTAYTVVHDRHAVLGRLYRAGRQAPPRPVPPDAGQTRLAEQPDRGLDSPTSRERDVLVLMAGPGRPAGNLPAEQTSPIIRPPAEYLALSEFDWLGRAWTAAGPPVTPDRLGEEYLIPLAGLAVAQRLAEGGTFTITDMAMSNTATAKTVDAVTYAVVYDGRAGFGRLYRASSALVGEPQLDHTHPPRGAEP